MRIRHFAVSVILPLTLALAAVFAAPAGADEEYDYEEETDWQSDHIAALSDATGRDVATLDERLRSLPDSAGSAAEYAVVAKDGTLYGLDFLMGFAENAAGGSSASVRVAEYRADGGSVLNYIDYNGYDFAVVRDHSRHGSYLGASVVAGTYSYLLGFSSSGRAVLLGGGSDPGDALWDESSWRLLAAASEPYESVGDLKAAIDQGLENAPVILYDVR